MKRLALNHGWEFRKGAGSVYDILRPSQSSVDLPHDFMIESELKEDAFGGTEAGFYEGGIGNYTKHLDIPQEWNSQRIMLEFDGSYMNTEVFVNGNFVTKHPYGYTPFHADLTDYIRFGERNRINVVVNNSANGSGRWYTGSGIYRQVSLLVAPPVHLEPWSTYIYTQKVDDEFAILKVETTIRNHTVTSSKEKIQYTIKDADDAVVSTGSVVIFSESHAVGSGHVNLTVPNPQRWDIQQPYLYTLEVELADQKDKDSVTFGIRTIQVDTLNGFQLNERTLNLKGGCIHHDNGLLGAKSFYDAEYRKIKLLKDAGFNSVRLAHNPPSTELLQACDQLGMLVINEAFDVWQMAKNPNDYHLYFDEWWKKDLTLFMKRDRNHPSIIAWSTGNEVVERYGLANGNKLAKELADYTRTLDSTRFVTNAMPIPFNGLDDANMMKIFEEWRSIKPGETVQNLGTEHSNAIFNEVTEQFLAPLDIVGYNYMEYRYDKDGEAYPERIIYGSESYPAHIDLIWEKVESLPYVIGDFTWTSYDYIGEAGVGQTLYVDEELKQSPLQGPPVRFPYRLAYCGDFDLCGYPRPQSFYRRIVWGSEETFVAVHHPKNNGKIEYRTRWSWPEAANHWSYAGYECQMTKVDVYSAAEEVELFVNGVSQGKAKVGKKERFSASFDVMYDPGELVAISYSKNEEVSRQVLVSAADPTAIAIRFEEARVACRDGQGLAYATIELVDKDNIRVPMNDQIATASVEGQGVLVGFGTGNPNTTANYTKGNFPLFEGRVQAIIRSNGQPGIATLKISIPGFEEQTAEVMFD